MSSWLEPHWLGLLFFGGCIAGVALLARIAGWSSLAATLGARSVPSGQSLRFVTGSLGSTAFPIKYKHCLRVVVHEEGFYISLMAPFKLASPALSVPWTQIESCTVEQVFSTQIAVFRLRGQWSVLKIRGLAGQVLREAYERHLQIRSTPRRQ